MQGIHFALQNGRPANPAEPGYTIDSPADGLCASLQQFGDAVKASSQGLYAAFRFFFRPALGTESF